MAAKSLEQRAAEAEMRSRIDAANLQRRLTRAQTRAVDAMVAGGTGGSSVGAMGDYSGSKRTRTRSGARPMDRAFDAQLTERTLADLRAESQRIMRDVPVLRSAMDRDADLVAGVGVNVQCTSKDKAYAGEAIEFFYRWAERYADARGRETYFSMRRRAYKTANIDGDGGWVLGDGFGEDTADVLRLQWIDAARIVTPMGSALKNWTEKGQHTIFAGVEMNALGRPVAYWIAPYTSMGTVDASKAQRVSEEDFIPFGSWQRSSATRCEPVMAAIIPKVEYLHRMNIATLLGVEMAACIGLIYEQANPLLGQLATAGETIARNDGSGLSDRTEEIYPGMIKRARPGEKISQIKQEAPGPFFGAFQEMQYREIGAELGGSYEWLLMDFSKSSAYAARTAFTIMHRRHKRTHVEIEHRADRRLFRRVVGMGIARGIITAMPEDWDAQKWVMPGGFSFEVDKEAAALETLLRCRGKSLTQWYDEQGMDRSEEFAVIAEEQEEMSELGIDPVHAPGTAPSGGAVVTSENATTETQSGAESGDAKNAEGGGDGTDGTDGTDA